MKKYDVYGIGNAIVDLIFEVDEQFLQNKEVEKGLMTLVEEERQTELLKDLKIDDDTMKGGGSAANTIVAANQFGGSCYYSCKVANDRFGEFFLNDLAKNGVDTNLTTETTPAGITGRCLVLTTPDAERTMNTFLGITADLSEEEISIDALKNSSYMYAEGYLVPSPSGRNAIIKAKKIAEENGVRTAITFSDPSMVKYFRKEMIEVIGGSVDLLFCNEEEAMLFTETNSVEEAREALKETAKRFAITQGKNGAMIFDGETFIDIEPYSVDAVDSNGAGDMFAGAFLYAITHGHSYAEAGKLASLASSKIVSQFGPRFEKADAEAVLKHLTEV